MTILLVESDQEDARLAEKAISQYPPIRSHVVHRARDAREATRYLRQHSAVDVVLSEMRLPDAEGLETLAIFRQVAGSTPVVFVVAADDKLLAQDALGKGAQDYLVKGEYADGRLSKAVGYAVECKRYQDEIQAAQAQARDMQDQVQSLRQECEQLTVMNKAKDDFISLASHQLRTPATGVKQYIGMVLEGFAGDVPEHIRPFIAKAYESNERQLAIVNDLLRVAQLDAGRLELRPQPTALKEMLLNIVSEQSSKFSQRQQKLVFEPGPGQVFAAVDAGRMRMVFDNLIDNASKYTPEHKTVTVGLRQDSGQVEVSIKDEGVGIAPENIDKVFEKFGRVANSRSELVGGTGLGLYWAKRIVDLHHGTIQVRSVLGEGSEFVVRLGLA